MLKPRPMTLVAVWSAWPVTLTLSTTALAVADPPAKSRAVPRPPVWLPPKE